MAKQRSMARPAERTSSLLPPLVLDVDDALLRTDLLHESAIAYIKANLFSLFNLVVWLLRGKAALKQELGRRVILDVETLPYNAELVDFAADAHRAGRQVGLATAADELVARRIAKRFDFISFVIASDGVQNLKGVAKASALERQFLGGFAYAGDSRADLDVWRRASSIILVGTSRKTTRGAMLLGKPVEAVFPKPALGLRGWVKAIRLHQWAKNALVFIPMILAGMADQPVAIASAAIAFLAMSLMASGTYLVNDLFDLADDRAHPTKRNRPLASGRLHIKHGVAGSLLLIAGSLALAATLGLPTFTLMLIYMATTLGYSFYLKRQPVLDAFTLASLFTLRLGVGITAVGAAPSPWLLVFSMFLFASLAFAKRQSEIQRNLRDGRDVVKGRGYLATDGGIVMPLGIATAMTAINIMVLYIMNDIYSADFYAYPVLLWALPVGLFLWVCRVWLLCHRGQLEDDPVAFALKDPTSLAIGGVMGAAFVGGWLL